eukprot:jgi/Botrbrau1/20564/Bobra.145_2s0111.1
MFEAVFFPCTALLLVSTVLSADILSGSAGPFEQKTLVVDGFGSSTAAADIASIAFSVSATAPDAVSARQKAATLVRNITNYLSEKYSSNQNISVTTSSLNFYPQYGYTAKAFSSYVNGYEFQITLNAALRNITAAALADVIDGIFNAGDGRQDSARQTSVLSIEFGLSSDVAGALYRSSRKTAALDALSTAEQYCSYLGLTLGNLLQLFETTTDDGQAGPFAQPSSVLDNLQPSDQHRTTPIILPPQAVNVHVKAIFAVYGRIHPDSEPPAISPSPSPIPSPPPPDVPTGVEIPDTPPPPLYESLFRAGFPGP